MPDPTSSNTNEELNTAKQVNLDNVGALNRDQLTPKAAAAPQGHDVAGHDHAPGEDDHDHAGHSHDPGELDFDDDDEPGHDHGPAEANPYLLPGVSLALLLVGLALDYYKVGFFTGYVRPAWYGLAFVLVGWKVVKAAVLSIPSGNVFNEFLLMSLATIGAFAIGEYPEGVAVMSTLR